MLLIPQVPSAAAILWAALRFGLLAAVLVELILILDPVTRWKLRHIPGPFALPLLGCVPDILRQGAHAFFLQCRKKYGPVFKARTALALGRSWVVVVADTELMRQVGFKLRNHEMTEPSLMRGVFKEVEEASLFRAADDFWRLVRSAWQPAFASTSLAGYLPRMTACAEQLADRMEDRARDADGGGDGGGRVNMWRELGGMTLQVVGSTAYGYSRLALLLPELRPLWSVLAHALPDEPFTRMLQARTTLLTACLELIRGWKDRAERGSDRKARRGAAEAVAAAVVNGDDPTRVVPTDGSRGGPDGAIAAAPASPSAAAADVAAAEASAPAQANGGDAPAKPHAVEAGSFLGLMLSARDKATGQGLSDPQLVAQVQIFILAGYETTANALAFAVHCLATHPEAEARLIAEVDSVLGPDRRLPTAADLPRLVYTEAVFNEAMRLYPPAHAMTRRVGGCKVPPGVPLVLAIYAGHHDPRVWPRPEEFIPERFLPDSPLHPEVAARVPNAHTPFGWGSRMCIGWKFALQEAKIALATLYRRLRFELEPGQVPLPLRPSSLTMAPRDGVWVRPVMRC
ncbi:hypothetical protein GPECTOR_4g740 [Gonium pectorale]|uniref:Cytochrome P450 n=1 Tax=Gonium pectorale TaxID=33097 RepID=A0A150GY08_GONPE|nr:hypothetical protein GPECTOR_4g740 [Gonium pectorale]|eukprot:KXZ54674.1 hypothetical protein GPECTOR_4g740 [Gonium pectorale]